MLEDIRDRSFKTFKLIATIAGAIYFWIGATFFAVPMVLNFPICEVSPTYIHPTSWLFWPIGIYRTIALANRLQQPVETVWIARWCFYDDQSAFDALSPPSQRTTPKQLFPRERD